MNINMNLSMSRMLGVTALVLGVFLLLLAYHAANAPIDQLSNALTGRYTDRTMWYLLLGITAATGGGVLILFGKRVS